MSVTEALKAEITGKPDGTYAPKYYYYAGFLRARKEGLGEDIAALRAYGVNSLFSSIPVYIYKNDMIVGSIRPMWVKETAASADEIKTAVDSVNAIGERCYWQNHNHFAPDYPMILERGVPGILEDLQSSAAVHADDPKRVKFLHEMALAVEGFRTLIANYAAHADSLIGTEGYSDDTLRFIRDNCQALIRRAPETFAEALQLVFLCHRAFFYEERYAMAFGRMDQYLYPFYEKDTESGIITPEKAQLLLENAYMKLYEHHVFTNADEVDNICIGGSSPDGTCDINPLSYRILAAVGTCNIPGPNLSARITPNTPDEFLDACLCVIGTGLGYPALMNDTVNIAALRKYGYEEKDLYNYCMVGCIENFIPGKQPAWTDSGLDVPRYFEYLFNRGKGIYSDTQNIDTGALSEITSMDEFMKRFSEQLRAGARESIEIFNKTNIIPDPENYTSPFLSCFCRECIERGLDINNGGTKYPSVHGTGLLGIGTVCDSLAAIEKTVFIDHTLTLETIRDAMTADFKGYEDVQKLLLDAPKYGNNDPFADKYSVWFVDFLADVFSEYKTYDGGGMYIIMASNTGSIWQGKTIGATPDGRHAGLPVSDAASPTYGKDRCGVTSTVLSVSKPDYTRVACGSVVNQKFLPSMFRDGNRERLLSLIRVYFARGGQEMQINATSPEILSDAMAHPENYSDLVVRVSGFSAFYISLEEDIQLDILRRTQQTA